MSNRRKIPGRKPDPGGYTVRHPPGTYLVRYAHSAPFTVQGRLGMTGGGSIGVNPVIVRPDGEVMILDPGRSSLWTAAGCTGRATWPLMITTPACGRGWPNTRIGIAERRSLPERGRIVVYGSSATIRRTTASTRPPVTMERPR